jgi:3-methyladenine DNA glycosylase/8-oxoguanine DNA glycosylase
MTMHQEAITHLGNVDPILGRLINTVGPCTLRPKDRRSPFEALVTSVTFQQLNGTGRSNHPGSC